MEAIHLFRDDFDTLENHSPHRSTLIKTVIPKGHITAHGVLEKYLSEMDPVKLYLGYDGEMYPKYRIEKVEL